MNFLSLPKMLLVLVIGFGLGSINLLYRAIEFEKQIKIRDEAILKLQQQTPHVTFEMDNSCFEQINNTNDGLLRIKFNKETK